LSIGFDVAKIRRKGKSEKGKVKNFIFLKRRRGKS
jgi:hypothetical protein